VSTAFGSVFPVQADEGVALPLTFDLRLGIGDRLEEFGRGGLGLLRQRVEDIGEPVVPAPLLLTGGVNLPERGPDAQVSVGHRESRELQPALLQAAQDLQPRFLTFTLAALAGQHDLLARAAGAHCP
jgi:hypothetical protein